MLGSLRKGTEGQDAKDHFLYKLKSCFKGRIRKIYNQNSEFTLILLLGTSMGQLSIAELYCTIQDFLQRCDLQNGRERQTKDFTEASLNEPLSLLGLLTVRQVKASLQAHGCLKGSCIIEKPTPAVKAVFLELPCITCRQLKR